MLKKLSYPMVVTPIDFNSTQIIVYLLLDGSESMLYMTPERCLTALLITQCVHARRGGQQTFPVST